MSSAQPIPMPDFVHLSQIKLYPALQAREGLDEERVTEYAALLAQGVQLPPIEVVRTEADGSLLVDGFHRYEAAKRIGADSVKALVYFGEWEDAVLRAAKANASHGLPRSNAAKRAAVRMILELDGWHKRSDRQIAEAAGLTHHGLVGAVRAQLAAETHQATMRERVGRDGITRTLPAQKQKKSEHVDVLAAVEATFSRCQSCGGSGTRGDLDPLAVEPGLCLSCYTKGKSAPSAPAPAPAPVKHQPAYLNAGEAPQHWDTPANIVDVVQRVARVLGSSVTLDPCASPTSTVGAVTSLRKEDGRDGLAEDWTDVQYKAGGPPGLVYVNPPFDDLGPWIDACLSYVANEEGSRRYGHVLLLIPLRYFRTDVRLLSRHRHSRLRCEVETRAKFLLRGVEEPGGYPFPVAIYLLSTDPRQNVIDWIREELSTLGPVLDLDAQRDSVRAWDERLKEIEARKAAAAKQIALPLVPESETPPKKRAPRAKPTESKPVKGAGGSPLGRGFDAKGEAWKDLFREGKYNPKARKLKEFEAVPGEKSVHPLGASRRQWENANERARPWMSRVAELGDSDLEELYRAFCKQTGKAPKSGASRKSMLASLRHDRASTILFEQTGLTK